MSQQYNTVVNALEQFSANHLSLKRFKCSFFEQMDNFSTSENSFPILYAIPNDISFEDNIDVMSFRVYCVDVLQKDRSNEQTILNETLLILRDLNNWFKQNDYNNLNVLNNPRAIPVNNFLTEFTTGWYIDIDVEVEGETNDCSIPFSNNFILTGITCDTQYVNQFLTCETLQYCSEIINIDNRITFLESLTGQTSSTLAQVLTVGNSTGNIPITNPSGTMEMGVDDMNNTYVRGVNNNASFNIISPSGFYYPAINFHNAGGYQASITGYANNLYVNDGLIVGPYDTITRHWGYFNNGYGIDTTQTVGTDVLNIGTVNADVINIGTTGSSINLFGTVYPKKDVIMASANSIKSVNGGGTLSLDGGDIYTSPNDVYLSNDNNGFAKSYLSFNEYPSGFHNEVGLVTNDTSTNTKKGSVTIGVYSNDVSFWRTYTKISSDQHLSVYKNQKIDIVQPSSPFNTGSITFTTQNAIFSNNVKLNGLTASKMLWLDANKQIVNLNLGSGLLLSGGTLSVTGGTTDNYVTGGTYSNGTLTLNRQNGSVNISLQPQTNIQASTTSLTPNITLYSEEVITTLSTGLTINAPTGTPVNGQTFIIRIKDDGTVRTLTWDSIYRFSLNNQAPANTTINKTAYFYCKYNSTDTKWDVMWVNNF